MARESGDRSKFFPTIEKKHGQPINFYINQLKELDSTKYPEQIEFLRENYGFSQTHANAVVMYVRGSKSSKRFDSPATYFKTLEPGPRRTAKAIFKTIQDEYPELELVVAWNQPILKAEKGYVLGLSATANYFLINPFSKAVFDKNASKLKNYKLNKHTVQIPLDWEIDKSMLIGLVKGRMTELRKK